MNKTDDRVSATGTGDAAAPRPAIRTFAGVCRAISWAGILIILLAAFAEWYRGRNYFLLFAGGAVFPCITYFIYPFVRLAFLPVLAMSVIAHVLSCAMGRMPPIVAVTSYHFYIMMKRDWHILAGTPDPDDDAA